MFSEDAKRNVIKIIDEFSKNFEESFEEGLDIDYNNWINVFENYISSFIRDFRRICFDNGDLVFYQKNYKLLEDYWKSAKNKTYELIKSKGRNEQ